MLKIVQPVQMDIFKWEIPAFNLVLIFIMEIKLLVNAHNAQNIAQIVFLLSSVQVVYQDQDTTIVYKFKVVL